MSDNVWGIYPGITTEDAERADEALEELYGLLSDEEQDRLARNCSTRWVFAKWMIANGQSRCRGMSVLSGVRPPIKSRRC